MKKITKLWIMLSLLLISSCGKGEDPIETIYSVPKSGRLNCSTQGTLTVCANDRATFRFDSVTNQGVYDLNEEI